MSNSKLNQSQSQDCDKKVTLSTDENEERLNKLENKVTAIDVLVSTIQEDISEIRKSQENNRQDISEVKEINIRQEEAQKNFKEDMQFLKENINKLTDNQNNSLSKKIGDKLLPVSIVGGLIVVVYILLKFHTSLFGIQKRVCSRKLHTQINMQGKIIETSLN
jgi:hypothetical protein